MLAHLSTCGTWRSQSCTCGMPKPWRVRKQIKEEYPWTVERLISNTTGYDIHYSYEPLMRCSTFEAAIQLVDSMLWLATGNARIKGDHRHAR